ncbi:MAG: hypothetical protein KF685_12895 [Acidobacteria bacterium]|nr:hypothetical protein [Acidobacteriota bacterium]
MPSSAGGFPWKVDGGYNTIVYIKNETDIARKYTVSLLFDGGGGYSQGVRELKPKETVAIDFKKLRDEQTEDINGNTIPLNIETGQIAWSSKGPDNRTTSGRSEQVNETLGIASTYACYNECMDSFSDGWVEPDWESIFPENSVLLTAYQVDINSYQQPMPPYPVFSANWDSNNPSAVSVNPSGEAYGVSGGGATITASWWADVPTEGENCQYYSAQIEKEAFVAVTPLVEILRSGVAIASSNGSSVTQNVVAGEKIDLTARVTGGTGSAHWTIEGDKAIKDYIVTVTDGEAVKAEKIDLVEADLGQSQISFYWIDGGSSLDATYTVTINGVPHSAIAKFNVMKPTSTLSSTTSNVSLGTVLISQMPNESIFALHYGNAFETPGIRFDASVTPPSGVSGQVVWARVANTIRKRTPTGESQQTLQGIGLDGVFPDLPDIGENEDSPYQPAEPPCSYTFISANDSFTTWILFKPSVANVTTIYVPLKKVSWSWSGTATRGTECNSWTLTNASRTQNPTGVNTIDYPEWVANIEDFTWQ